MQQNLFHIDEPPPRELIRYGSVLTASVNGKGVVDVDTVKGCTSGMASRPMAGCYDACYAASLAKAHIMDFTASVVRTATTQAERRAVERIVSRAPLGFFRIGTMGDPSHAWETTVETVEWLSEFARPVIITKHWKVATDEQLGRLADRQTVLNTSISALDTPAELEHRKRQIERFRVVGGGSVARIVSCDFCVSHPEGARMRAIQDELFKLRPVLDNPLRVFRNHWLVTSGIINVTKMVDLVAERYISIANPSTYIGHCSQCPDVCGIPLVGPDAKPGSHELGIVQRSKPAEFKHDDGQCSLFPSEDVA